VISASLAKRAREKVVVSRRGAEDAEKKADLGFYSERVVVFPSANSASLAKRAREIVVVFKNSMISSEASE
jgi:hypothetical protein